MVTGWMRGAASLDGTRATVCGNELKLRACCNAREASVGSDADMIDKEQMGEEKPVSLIGSLVCQTFCDLIMVMWNANSVNEVKYENLVERCV